MKLTALLIFAAFAQAKVEFFG